MISFRSFVEWLMPWYKPTEQAGRVAQMDDLAVKAKTALRRNYRVSRRAEAMLNSYKEAQEHVWHH